MSVPLVSVVVPTHNRAGLLSRTIDSVLDQTFEDFELIIIDDGSTDETPQIVDKYTDDRLDYIRFEENQGANAARNVGIEASCGKFISFLDSDDVFYPQNLEVTIDRLQRAPLECAGVFTSFAYIEDGKIINVSYAPDGPISYEEIQGNPIGGFSAVMFRSSVLEEVGLLDEDLVSHQDLDLFIRILRQYTMVGIDKILLDYHIHDTKISSDVDRRLQGQEQFLQKHGRNLPPLLMGHIYYERALKHADQGKLYTARRDLMRAIRVNPKRLRYYYHLGAMLFGVQAFEISIAAKQRLNLFRTRGMN